MKTSRLLQPSLSLPSHPHSCLVCRQPCPASHSTKLHPEHGGLDFRTLSCSTLCGNVLTFVTQAFVQGFVISWVLCVGCRDHAWDLECHQSVSESKNRGGCGCTLRNSDKQGSLLDFDFNQPTSETEEKHEKYGAGRHISDKRCSVWDLDFNRPTSAHEKGGAGRLILDKQSSILDIDFNQPTLETVEKHKKCGARQLILDKHNSVLDLDTNQHESGTEKKCEECDTVGLFSDKQSSGFDSDFCQMVSDVKKNDTVVDRECAIAVLHVSDTEKDEQMTAKIKYHEPCALSEGSVGSNNSSLFFGENHEIEQMFQKDQDSLSRPVQFGMDVFLEPSLDGFIDFDLEACGPATNNSMGGNVFTPTQQITTSDADQGDCFKEQNSLNLKTFLPTSKTGTSFGSCSSMTNLENMTAVLDCTEMESCHQNGLTPDGAVLKTSPSSPEQLKSEEVPIKPQVPSNHSCMYCGKIFPYKRLLKQHLKSHKVNCSLRKETEPGFTCEFCAQSFMNQYSLKAHIRRKHSGETPVDCDICGKTQPSRFALSAHKKACHDFSSLCHICGAEFTGRTSYDKHMTSHDGIKRYFCDVCGAGFVHNTSLKIHASVHATSKCHQCHVCSRMFKAQHLLNEHLLKVHQCGPSLEHRIRGLKKMGVDVDREALVRYANHQCVVCSENLVNSVCQTHPQHTQRVFCCPACGDTTNSIVLFHQHVKWHKGKLAQNRRPADKPVPCRLSNSGDDTVIRCEVCAKTFRSLDYLSAHMHQHREARFHCHVCDKRFTYKCNLKSHLTTHLDSWPFQCETCCKKFRDKHSFKKHQLKHTQPQFPCRVCGKALTRRPYLLKHYQKMHPEYHAGVE